MSRKSPTETLIAAMRILARDIQSGDGVANAAIAEAADRLAEQQARIAELEAQAAIGRRAVEMLKGLEWPVSRLTGERYCPSCGQHASHNSACELSAILRDAEQANNRVILDSSDHVRDATEMVTDRQLADAVNELRDIAIKYHAAGQLRERIAGVVRGLVRGEPGAVAAESARKLLAGDPAEEAAASGERDADGDCDPLYDEAVLFVTESRKALVPSVQRKFNIGYNRAARLMEQMEADGVVTSPGHNGSREVLVGGE